MNIRLEQNSNRMKTKDPNIGRLLVNRYQIIELIGTGVVGTVYLAQDNLFNGAEVAVKFIYQKLLNDKIIKRFEQEATISAFLGEKNPHVVKIIDYGLEENQIPFYVMEFLTGKTLNDILKVGALSLPEFLTFSRQICSALDAAHNGIIFKGQMFSVIHEDIKPSNIFLANNSSFGFLVKILDFGIAKLTQGNDYQTDSFVGSPAYSSPEQIDGKKIDNRSDIYSLGVIMYEMLTQELPIVPENNSFGAWHKAHHQFIPKPFDPELEIPKELSNIIMRCLAKEIWDRPQSVGEILQILENLDTKSPTNFNNDYSSNQISKTTTIHSLDTVDIIDTLDSLDELDGLDTIETICLESSWPKDKPKQKIVFPCLMTNSEQIYPTLWVMLELDDIVKRISSIRYTDFLFRTYPHPMILWITALYNQEASARWLPCYLDLKTELGQQVTRNLAICDTYRILLFAIEQPKRCQYVLTANIDQQQQTNLKQWANISKNLQVSHQPEISKKSLKQDLEDLKPEILIKLKDAHHHD